MKILYDTRKRYSLFAGLVLFVSVALGVVSCGEEDMPDMNTIDFDRSAMLANIADNLIIPNFESLQSSVDELSLTTDAFIQEGTEESLSALRNSWVTAVKDHQHCSAFGFGPAQLLLGEYARVLGVFPVNEDKIELAILDSDFDLENSFDRDIRGFYSVEYLIYGKGISDGELIASFGQNRKDYLRLLVDELKTTFDDIVEEWNTDYREEFVNDDATSAGSSISLLYNGFVKDYENLKNFKVELPAGLSADQNSPMGSLVEAFYSGISRDLIIEHFASSKNIWYGQSRAGQDGIGFEEYLETVVGGPELINQTKAALARIDESIANLPQGRLSESVNAQEIITLRDDLQSNTANFKSSIVSLLGLTITFNSGDGD